MREKLESSIPAQVKCVQEPEIENKTSNAEITLKSATLPRRKTTKAQIELAQPKPSTPTSMGFKTEMAHRIEAPPPPSSHPQSKLTTQRSEVIFPVTSTPEMDNRASSLEPEKTKSIERIIPITIDQNATERKDVVTSPPTKPPTPRPFQTQQKSTPLTQKYFTVLLRLFFFLLNVIYFRSTNISRSQSTQEESDLSGEPIKKSPREYIIPIAVEGGGYVTPRAGSLEPSDTTSTTTTMTNNSRSRLYNRARRMK